MGSMTSRAEVFPKVLSLRCRNCGESLAGLAVDRVFSCPKCRLAAEVSAGRLNWREYTSVRPRQVPEVPVLYLPFWEFSIDYEVRTPDPVKIRAYRTMGPFNRVYVMGYSALRVAMFGDPGLQLTFHQPPVELDEGGYILGCTRDSAGARVYVEPFLLSLFDRKADVTGVSLGVREKGVRLLALPFHDHGTHLVDGLTGMKLASAAFSDLHMIREAAREGKGVGS